MRALVARINPARGGSSFASTYISAYGRSPAYRRISSQATLLSNPLYIPQRQGVQLPVSNFLRSQIQPQDVLSRTLTIYSRHFSTRSRLAQEQKAGDDIKAKPATDSAEQDAQSPGKSASGEPGSSETKSDQASGEQKAEGEAGAEGEGEQKKKEDAPPPPPPPHGDKTPWQVFTETLSSEFKKSKEWNESTKALASGYQDFTQNETIKRMRSGAQAASDATSSTAGAAVKNTGKALGQAAAWTWDTPVVKGVRAGVNMAGRGVEKATRPLRETEAYKNVRDTIDDGSSSRYGGWTDKEERRARREALERKRGNLPTAEKFEEDPNAGTNVTLHKDAAWKESWRDFRDSNRFMQSIFSMKDTYKESENPLISTARSITDRVAGFFAENETAMVIKKFREIDPGFQLEPFLQEMREYILPEVLDAYVKGEVETLKLWLSAAQYQVYAALMQQYTTAGLRSDGRILDIRHVDILSARLLDPGEIPVFILTARTQEVHTYRNIKSGELAAGMDDKVQQVTYAIGVTRIPEDVSNPETRGWRLIELQKSARDYI